MKHLPALLGAAALAALACCRAAGATDMCSDMYECRFYAEQGDKLYKFDLSPLCSPTGYAYRDTINTILNDTYNFNICGNSPKRCNPQGSSTFLRYGVAVQSWGPEPPLGTLCPIPGTNLQEQCTQECEVLGIDDPQFRLQSPSNAQTGGLIIRHDSMPNVLGNRHPCPRDIETGVQLARQVTFHIACNPGETLKWIDGDESPTCSYQLFLESKFACGAEYDFGSTAVSSSSSSSGLAAGMFFIGLLVSLLIVGGYLLYTRHGHLFKFGGAASSSTGTASSSYSAVGKA